MDLLQLQRRPEITVGALGFVAALIIALAFICHLVVIVFAVRAALRGEQTSRIGRALGVCFGALVVGVGLLAASFEFAAARAVGVAVVLTGFAVLALSMSRGRTSGPSDPARTTGQQ